MEVVRVSFFAESELLRLEVESVSSPAESELEKLESKLGGKLEVRRLQESWVEGGERRRRGVGEGRGDNMR